MYACCPPLSSSVAACLLLLLLRRPCPSGMVASNDSALYPNSSSYWADNGDGTRGFTSERACVTQDGYGYSARIASPCPVGTYNPRDTYSSCSTCLTGLTTSGVGAGRTIADCGLAAGYGFHSGAVTACPLGKQLWREVAQAVSA